MEAGQTQTNFTHSEHTTTPSLQKIGAGDQVSLQPAISDSAELREQTNTALEKLAEDLDQGKSEHLTRVLSAMSKFHNYSVRNQLLILSQRPEATRVAGFRTWLSFGRRVRKGEKGIRIVAPVIKRGESPDESDDEESPVFFRVAHVFDIGQTDGEPLPEFDTVSGDPGEQLVRLETAITRAGITLKTVESLAGAEGISAGGTIKIVDGLTAAQRFSVLAHEWAHEQLHGADQGKRPSEMVRETEAEAVAFVVCQAVGLETGTASADYIQLYNGDKTSLLGSLERIQRTACAMLGAISSKEGVE